MTVLDAQALIAFLLDEPAAAEVHAIFRDPQTGVHVSALNIAEVIDVMARIHHRAGSATADALILLRSGGLETIPVDDEVAAVAGDLHARYYHRRDRPISMADSVALATAVKLREPLATSDAPLAGLAWSEDVDVIALQDSQGRRPSR